ncbi:MAG TPA: tetratricopeptide repeat protein [Chitinophagaceae bacterium]|nr:tetratricopeptide repeat protein [Chitinophagaceae bacterium]
MPRALSAFLASVLFSCLIQTNVAGQVAQNPPDSGSHRTFAMIMGISTYKFIRPLSFADSDAELFRDFLKSGGGGKLPDSNIYFLKNEEAKAANFLVKGMSWLRNRNLKAGDRLYIYLAGHGDAINQDEYFYLTYDCNPAGDKNNYLITGTIQLYNLKVRIAEASRKGVEVIFIMDACRTNELPGGGEGQQQLQAAISEKQAGEIIMLATGAGQESLEDPLIGNGHGLFTYYLVDGLSGLADTEGAHDNLVTLDELEKYIATTVPTYAQEKYNRKQNPFLCCDDSKKKVISKVDTAFLKKWILTKKITGQLRGSGGSLIKRGGAAAGRGFKIQMDHNINYDWLSMADTSILEIYNSFNRALKDFNLTGNGNSAEEYYQQLYKLAPTNSYTIDAKLSLATEYINFAQSKINLYLEGRDVSSIQRIRSQLDADDKSDEITNSLDRMEKVARQDFSEVGNMLERAIEYAEVDDENFRKKLLAKRFFFKAQGYFDKGASTTGLRLAIQDAMQAYKADPTAAYILNTLASLQLDNNKPDSAIYFGRLASARAPLWRYPYMNIANAFTKKNKQDSALVYFKKALAVDDSRADAYVDLGYFYFQQRKLDSAKVYYEKALLLDPKNAPANNNMGWLLRESRLFDLALSYFRKSLAYDPAFFNAYNGISRVFTDMRMFDSARAYYQKALKNYPDKLITSNYIGQFYQEQNQVDSARAYYVQAAVYDPNYDAPFINLGRLYAQTKQYDSATYYYRKALELNSKNFRGYNQLGLMFTDMKNYDSAFYYYKKGLEINPDNSIVLNNMGLAYYNGGKFDSAAAYFQRVMSISPDNPYAANNLGLVFHEMKKLDSAMFYYSKAMALKKDLPSAQGNIGRLLYEQKDYDGAKYYLKNLLEAHPENMQALSNLEKVYKQTNEFDSAIYYYTRSLQKGVVNSTMYNNLGRLYFSSEQFDEAARWYNMAIQHDPKSPFGYYNLGSVFANLQHPDSAVVMYKRSLALDPNYFTANLNLGVAYHDLGQYDSAIAYIKKAILINPKENLPYYYLAQSFAKNNKPEDALRYLEQALQRGYDLYEYIVIDPDFNSIRKYAAYKTMMKKYFPRKYKEEDD